jgi:hypothetical protein
VYCGTQVTVFRRSLQVSFHGNVPKMEIAGYFKESYPRRIDQKQLENMKCFKYLGSLLTDDGRCTCEIKSRIAMAKAEFNKKKNIFTS